MNILDSYLFDVCQYLKTSHIEFTEAFSNLSYFLYKIYEMTANVENALIIKKILYAGSSNAKFSNGTRVIKKPTDQINQIKTIVFVGIFSF